MAKQAKTAEAEQEEPINQEELNLVDDLQVAPETVRETLESAIKDGQPQALTVPADFDDEDKKIFGTLPRPAQEFVINRLHKRYSDQYTKANGDLAGYKKRWDPVAEQFKPFEQLLKSQGLTEAQVLQNYIRAEQSLKAKPLESVLYLAKAYGVTTEQLLQALGGKGQQQEEQDETDPTLKPVLDRLGKIETAMSQGREYVVQQRDAELGQAILSFEGEKDAAGQLVYPHATDEAVRARMSALIATNQIDIQKAGGILPALKLAYDEAVFANPQTREAALKARDDAEAKKRAEEEKKRVAKARHVGSSMSGSSPSGAAQSQNRGSSVRESLRQAAEQINFNH